MALFKIFKGLDADLSKNKPNTNEGYCYFTTDTGKMYIDIQNGANTATNSQYRVCLNAAKADVATKLATSNAGSTGIPVYFSNGIPVSCSNTLNINTTGNAATATRLTSSAGAHYQPVYMTNGVPAVCNYISTHPEGTSIILPFSIGNDLSNLSAKGGSVLVYETSSTDFTAKSLTNTRTIISNDDNLFDGTPKYNYFTLTAKTVTVVIDIYINKLLTYTNHGWIDFGNAQWGCTDIDWYILNDSTDLFNKIGTSKGVYHKITIDSSSTGFNTVRLVCKNWFGVSPRIAQIGIINYTSSGLRNSFMSTGFDDNIYRSITPGKNATYNLGNSSAKWNNIYANTFHGSLSGNASSATKLTSSGGSATLPIYMSDGKPIPCNTTLGVSVTGNAATATKLQTARTINGTSFDGTANITTSKWGTSRTLTLAQDSSGSVTTDGSANFAINVTNNKMKGYTFISGMAPWTWYKSAFTYTNPTAPTDDWYVKIILEAKWISDFTPLYISADYSNKSGKLLFILDGYDSYWSGYLTNYTGSNILAVRRKQQTSAEGYRTQIFIKLAKPVEYNGSVPNGNITVYSPYTVNSITTCTAAEAGELITLRHGHNSNTPLSNVNKIYGSITNADLATKATQDGNGSVISSTYLKLSGGTMTGSLNFANNTWNFMGDDCYIGDYNMAGCVALKGANGATGLYFVPYSGSTAQKVSIDGAGIMTITGTVASTFKGNLTGNATTASTLQTARTISLTGDVTGSVSFNGGSNVSITTTVANDSHTHTYIPPGGANPYDSSNDTISNWSTKGNNSTWWYGDTGTLTDKPSTWGFIWQLAYGSDVNQLWFSQSSGKMMRRSGNSSGWATSWKQIWCQGDSVTGAVWNDYAECRESNCEDFGYVLMENGDDTLTKTTERLSHFAGISSDTWGFSQGETDKAKTPIAVAGRVLVYPYQDRNNYKPGDCVCAAPGGTIDIMTREEIINWPDRIVGTVSCVPDYEEWGGGEMADRPAVKVNGRIWIKVK